MRGFDVRGIGPRVRSTPYGDDGALMPDSARESDALGGRAYYMARAELEFPISSKLRSLGLRPSAFVDVGSLFGLKKPTLVDSLGTCTGLSLPVAGGTPTVPPPNVPITPGLDCASLTPGVTGDYARVNGAQQSFIGNSPKPRLSIGVGVNWISPFGPLRIDVAKALLKQDGDQTKFFSFNVGTQF
jgi:outer membrane protein insertion porin family